MVAGEIEEFALPSISRQHKPNKDPKFSLEETLTKKDLGKKVKKQKHSPAGIPGKPGARNKLPPIKAPGGAAIAIAGRNIG
uniref:Uncharacterized protein n=1 Tax=Glossina brevipalpis TaxID=37001 RepID=A0A1A9X0Q3_9MUSC